MPAISGCYLEILQHTLRIEARVLIVEAGDVAERDDVVFRSVEPAAAIFFGGERPAHGVNHLAFFNGAGRDFPQLFYANAVHLRVKAFLQIVFGDELLGQRAARAFRQHRDLGLNVIAGLEVGFLLVVLVHAFIVGANADDVVAVGEKLRACKSGKDGDSGLLDFFSQPLHKAVDGDHIVAMVLQWRRRQGQAVLAFFCKEVNVFVRDFSIERRFVAPAGKKLVHGAGIKQRAGKRMLAEFTGLFQHVDIFLAQRRFRIAAVVAVDELGQDAARRPARQGRRQQW